MAKVIKFPQKVTPPLSNTADPYRLAKESMEKRFGVPLFQYLGLEGDPVETRKIVQRNLLKERLEVLTKYMNDPEDENTTS